MDPVTMLALGAALGGAGGGGSTRQTQQANLTNTLGINVPITSTLGSSIGGSLSQPASPAINAPQTTTANPSVSANDTGGGGGLPGFLPNRPPIPGYGQGAGFAPLPLGGGNDDLLLLLMIGGAAFFLLQE